MSTISKTYRGRRWSVASNFLTRHHIENGLDRPAVFRYAGIVHDRDPETATHGHVFLELTDARTAGQVMNYFSVPTIVIPVVGQKGDPHSFARCLRYLTHESPGEQAKGKVRYKDSEVFASRDFNWRDAINELNVRQGHSDTLLDQIMAAVLKGTMTPLEVHEEYPAVYLKHSQQLRRLQKDHFALERDRVMAPLFIERRERQRKEDAA